MHIIPYYHIISDSITAKEISLDVENNRTALKEHCLSFASEYQKKKKSAVFHHFAAKISRING